MKWNMAIANRTSTTPPCEMLLFQLKPPRSCLSLCLPLSPTSFNLLITCESLKQSASENKSSAVFFKNEIQLLYWQNVFWFCRRARGTWRRGDLHPQGDGTADGYTRSSQMFLFYKSGLPEYSHHFSFVRQHWSWQILIERCEVIKKKYWEKIKRAVIFYLFLIKEHDYTHWTISVYF